AAGGGDPAERQAVARQLQSEGPTLTPLGRVHFSRSGALTGMGYSLYHVARDGALSYDRSLRVP
ncbi:MAG: hypothetical protein J2O48_07490, partial [Solirubrobacterales bacterium]|nr:hypothetical protein [Solirubrobacterales bacterium]